MDVQPVVKSVKADVPILERMPSNGTIFPIAPIAPINKQFAIEPSWPRRLKDSENERILEAGIQELKESKSSSTSLTITYMTNASKHYESKTFVLNSRKNIRCSLIFDLDSDRTFLTLRFEKKVIFKNLKVILNRKTIFYNTNVNNLSFDCNSSYPFIFDMQIDKSSNLTQYTSEIFDIFKNNVIREFKGSNNEVHTYNIVIIYSFFQNCEVWEKALEAELNKKKFSDFTITVNNNKKFKVHKMVLYYRSPVFQKMIDSDMKEKQTNNINFNNIDPMIAKEFIKYIYTDECDFSVGVQDLFRLAHMYDIEDLQMSCEHYMSNCMSISDITDTLRLISLDYNKLDVLKVEVEKFIKTNEPKLVQDENFVKYYLDIMASSNIHIILTLAMKNNNENFKLMVKDYIRKHAKEVYSQELFRKVLLANPIWAIDLTNYFINIGTIGSEPS